MITTTIMITIMIMALRLRVVMGTRMPGIIMVPRALDSHLRLARP
jgi:hypothetical protein